ncbi:hypothetical protein ACFWZ2_13035 [Streptomyces sp. NPDC059002]|uniref:hypothetical protein n=1 Tax=Streptomyces sp. NPDC059002 TaxID=3346690 RepID=UPI0036B912E7
MTAPVGPPATVPALPTVLHRAVRYELHRLRALKSTWIVLGVLLAASLLNGALLLLELPTAEGGIRLPLDTTTLADWLQHNPTAQQVPLSALLLVFVFGTGPVSSELRFHTARTSWLTLGSRTVAYAAKLIVGAASVLAAACTGLLLQAATGWATLTIADAPQPDWGAAVPAVLRYLLIMACWPVLAAGVAALLGSRVAAALALTVWPLLGERIAGFLLGRVPGLDGVGEWLPFTAARAALHVPGDETDPFVRALIGSSLAPATGLAVFLLWTAAAATAGWLRYTRRAAP